MGKTKSKYISGRDPGGFVAIPWSVLDSESFHNLSHPARSLLMEIARQYVRDNNGRLLTSMKYLRKRGWKSSDVVSRAKQELLTAGFIHETVKGHRPNRASWYAITWQTLDFHADYDYGAKETFKRSGYRDPLRIVSPGGVIKASVAPVAGVAPETIKTGSFVRLAA